MTSSSVAVGPPDGHHNQKGGWIGIDLGTSNCAVAVWDISRSRCKVLRLPRENLARPPAGSASCKGGKIVPSAVLFHDSLKGEICGASMSVGYASTQSFDDTAAAGEALDERLSWALVTSFKRVMGMTPRQAKELKSSDPAFWNSLPFRAVVLEATQTQCNANDAHSSNKSNDLNLQELKGSRNYLNKLSDVLGRLNLTANIAHTITNQSQAYTDGVAIRVRPLHPSDSDTNNSQDFLVTPLQVSTALLRSIREAASDYLMKNRKNIQAPGFLDGSRGVRSCVIGVPAHFGHAQRTAVQMAAEKAGFDGHIGVMTESSAAAMAYGLFVSPNVVPPAASLSEGGNNETEGGNAVGGKNVLVFDIGGGTTDVTIARMDFEGDGVQFRVVATAGDRRLGGDDVDQLLARYLLELHELEFLNKSNQWEFLSQCRRAKEELCGNGDGRGGDTEASQTRITHNGDTIIITRREFDSAIQPLVDRAEKVIDDAMSVLESHGPSCFIHEVVLVGGSTKIPTIRSMLRRRFPPPIPPDLCMSIPSETAVAQGLAIQAALASGAVPLWELKNSMMLDVMPHSIGVWVSGAGDGRMHKCKASPYTKGQIIQQKERGKHEGHFVRILHKNSPLPATGSAIFRLVDKDQPGVTVVAAELVGPGEVYQCVGVFDFLLHRLDKDSMDECRPRTREVKIGMALDQNGKFKVSIFDECDPEHRKKRRQYLEEETRQDSTPPSVVQGDPEQFYEDDKRQEAFTGTEIGLILFCILFFALYVVARVAFADVLTTQSSDEL